jgi:hypothetical protein
MVWLGGSKRMADHGRYDEPREVAVAAPKLSMVVVLQHWGVDSQPLGSEEDGRVLDLDHCS